MKFVMKLNFTLHSIDSATSTQTPLEVSFDSVSTRTSRTVRKEVVFFYMVLGQVLKNLSTYNIWQYLAMFG